jgi:hypothetical protein
MSAEYPDDATIHDEEQWETEGGRYGHREYRYRDGTGWHEYWGTRIEDWGTRVFASLDEARHYVNHRAVDERVS